MKINLNRTANELPRNIKEMNNMANDKMNASERALYEKAKVKGIHGLQVYANKIIFIFNEEYVKITKTNPSTEFVRLMKELV